MLFSATMPDGHRPPGRRMLKNPERVEVTPPPRTADRVEQNLYHVARGAKAPAAGQLLKDKA